MTIEIPKRVAENIDRFTGRAWLLPKLLDWWEKSDERLFLLTGGPGTGKSMILAWLAGFGPEPEDPTAQAQLAHIREAVKAAYFCQAASRNVNPQAFGESIANQLTSSVTGFADALTATLAERVQIMATQTIGAVAAGGIATNLSIGRIDLGTLGDELSFDRAFTQPLKKLYESGHRGPMLLLVDALDEAQTYTGVTLPDLLSQLDDLPLPVRILATTRDEPQVLKFFRKIRPFDLIKDAPPDVDDVQTYAEGRLSELAAIKAAKRMDFAQRLATQADGVFLYAAMVIDELLASPPSELPDLDICPLPDGLSGLYHDFLTRKLGKDEELWSDRYRPLLGLIGVAQGEGLTALQLRGIVKRDVDEIGDILRWCKQYLIGDMPEGPFRLFHKSFADFLLEEHDNLDYHIDAPTVHKRIAEYYWSVYNKDWSKCDDYGLNNLAAHLVSSNRIADLVALIGHSWMRVRYERAGCTYAEFQADIDLAWRAVRAASLPKLGHLIHLRAAALAVQEHVKVYDDEDLSILVGLRRSEEALKHARLRNTAQGQFQGLLTIYRAVVSSQHRSMAMMTLSSNARTVANEIGDAPERVSALCSLAREAIRMHDPGAEDILEDVKQCIHGIQDKGNRAWAERKFVSALIGARRLHEAEQISTSIDDDVQRAFAVESMAISLADSGHFVEAQRLSGSIKTTSILGKEAVQRTHAKTLAGIARALAAVGDTRAAAMFDEAEQAAMSIEAGTMQDEALEAVTAALIHSGRFSQAQRVLTGIHGWRKSRSLMGLVKAFARAEDFEKAEALVDTIFDITWRSFALHSIAQELARVGRYDEARSIEREFKEITSRLYTLSAIATALLQKGDNRANDVLDEAVRLCAALRSTSERAKAFRRLAGILVQAGDLDRARSVFEHVHLQAGVKRDDREYCGALRELSIALANVEDSHADALIDEVDGTIERLEDLWKNVEKREFAMNLSRVGRFRKAWQVLESNEKDLQRVVAWCELATCSARVSDNLADVAFKQAQSAAQEIVNDEVRDEALAKLSSILIKERWLEMAEDVVALLKRTRRGCEVLTGLAVALHRDNPSRARELFTLVEESACKERSKYSRDETLVILVSALASLGDFDNALRIASMIMTGGHRVTALCRLAKRLVLAGDPRGEALLSEGLQVASSGDTGDAWPEANDLRQEAMRLSLEGDSRANALWAKAQAVAGSLWVDWIWDDSQYRALGILDLAIAMAGTNDLRTDSTFDFAHRIAITIPYENARDQTLRKLVNDLIDVDRLETAERVLSDIHGDSERLTVVRDLVTAFTTAGQIDSALRLARSVPSEYYRREIMRNIAVAFARVNKMTDALQVLEETNLDGFIGALGMVHAAWRAASPGAVIASMRAVTSVVAWVRSDWNEIHKALMT